MSTVPAGRYDLHTHSIASDGTWAPSRIVEQAAAGGLAGIALTDHDTTAGWAEARDAAQREGIGFLPGIELTTKVQGRSVHLLGYLIDPEDPGIRRITEQVRSARVGRARTMVERLGRDFDIGWDDVTEGFSDGATIGRPHIADALVRRGYFADRSAVFREILHPASPYYVTNEAVETHEAVRIVWEAGGAPVLAHPAAERMRRGFPTAILRELVQEGLFGIELDHPENLPERLPELRRAAEELGLALLGSSDFHGEGKINRLGERTTDASVVQRMVDAAHGTQPYFPAR